MSLDERIFPVGTTEAWIRASLDAGSGMAELTVTGSCMAPALRPGTKIAVRRPSAPCRPGDVVLLRTALGVRLHRVVFAARGGLRTKGDQAVYLDPAVSASDVLAVWQSHESRPRAAIRVGLSLIRLFLRPIGARFRPGVRG